MALTRRTDRLTRKECIDLLSGTRTARVASVSIGKQAPVRLVCFPLPDGDVVIPTGLDHGLASVAADRPVAIRFEHFDRDARRGWVVRGSGIAQPMALCLTEETVAAGNGERERALDNQHARVA